MSGHMKTRHTEQTKSGHIVHLIYNGMHYYVPESVLKRYTKPTSGAARIPAQVVFSDLEELYTRSGVLLQGLRHRENMTQVEFAMKIGVTQANLSKMERGKRPIGKEIAKRIAATFNINYRYFLE